MLGWLTNQRSPVDEAAGALGSVKAARMLLAELETETPQYVVKELAKHFKNTPRSVLETPRGMDALCEIDEWAQRHLTELWKSVVGDSQGLTVSDAVWDALTQYYHRSYLGYRTCHRACGTAESPSKREQAKAAIIASRAMAAAARYLLVLRLRYLRAPGETWSQLWELIRWCDARGTANEPVELYPGGTRTTSERELLTAMLLEVAPNACLLPGQILALDRLLRQHAGDFQRSDQHDGRSAPFVYDRSASAPPQRWFNGLKVRPELRFFGLGAAYSGLCHARNEFERIRAAPDWLSQTRCSAENYAALLDRIFLEWAPEPPRRRHPREVCSGEILVAHDWTALCRLVKLSELALSGQSLAYDTGDAYKMNGVMATSRDKYSNRPDAAKAVSAKEALANLLVFESMLTPGTMESWSMKDTSESGLGATAEKDCGWVKVGMVIAYRHRESAEWKIARVRRLEREATGRLSIGMSRVCGKLSSARLWAGLGRIDYSRSANRTESPLEYAALMLRDGASSLLLPMGLYDPTQKYTLSSDQQHRVVRMEKPLEHGPNFERIEVLEVEMQCAA